MLNRHYFLRNRLPVYLRLMRVDKPIGTLLLLWPTFWAIWIASEGRPHWLTVAAFTLGTFLMRSAGCVVNDWADKDFDGHVERTQNRPFATGEVSSKEAEILFVALCGTAALCLLPFNLSTWMMSLPALFLVATYPLTKRFFPLPQLYLGVAFSFGIPMAFTAIQGHTSAITWWLFAANICWTVAYDTIYAIADKPDDLKIGIKTSAITFGRYDAQAAMFCHFLFDLLMLRIGILLHAAWPFWAAWLLVAYLQTRQYQRIKSRDRQACFQTFLDNNSIGWIWFTALAVHYALI